MAQSQIYTKKAQVHVVAETTVDTYLAPAGSGAGIFLATVPDVPMTLESSNYDPNYTRGDFLQMDETPGPCAASIKFQVPLKGSGTAGTAPDFRLALMACGMEEVDNGTTSTTYGPSSLFDGSTPTDKIKPSQSYSVSILENGIRWAIKGAFGTWSLSAEVGKPGILDFSFTGAYVAVIADALEAPTYQTTVAPSFLGASLALAGPYTPIGVNALSLDLGNTLAIRRDVNDSSGVMGARITGRRSTGSIDPEMVTMATHDYFALWRAGTSSTLTTGVIGATAGNRWALTLGRIVRRPPELGNRDGIRTLSVPFSVSSVATDVESTNLDVSLQFT